MAARSKLLKGLPLPAETPPTGGRSMRQSAESHVLAIVESMPDAFITLDQQWRFTYLNPQAEPLLRRRRGDLLGKVIWETFPDAVDSGFALQAQRVLQEQAASTFEAYYPRLALWLTVVAYPAHEGIAVYFQDITARKNVEEELHTLRVELETRVAQRTTQLEQANGELQRYFAQRTAIYDAMGCGVVVGDNAGQIRYVNAAAETIIGITSADSAQHTLFDPPWHVVDEAGTSVPVEDFPAVVALRTGIAQRQVVVNVVRASGETVCLQVDAVPMEAPNGDRQVVLSFVDITPRLEAERLAEQAKQLAEELARIRADLIAVTSHELRTPISAMLGFVDLLQTRWRALDEGRRLNYIQKIGLAARRQRRLVDDLLTASLLDLGAVSVASTPQSLSALIDQAAAEVEGSYPGQVISRVGPENAQVLADALHALQILVNLMDNAAKYSSEGSPMEVSWTVGESNGNRFGVVRVRDHGAGIPEQDRDRLFNRFGRVSGSRAREGRKGVGLGLYLAQGLARAMGGDLALEATGPDGSIFQLRLPVPPT
jgi:PAS domain S-box-containing protein